MCSELNIKYLNVTPSPTTWDRFPNFHLNIKFWILICFTDEADEELSLIYRPVPWAKKWAASYGKML